MRSVTLGVVSKPRVTLVTSSDIPHLSDDFSELPAALEARGLDVRVSVWDDPTVDWADAGLCVILTVTDFAERPEEFFAWARTVPRIINDPAVLEWNSDKHYLIELAERGMPTIETTWLEPAAQLSKHQVHTRMPANGDFVVKSSLSSNRHTTGRYTSTDARSRAAAIEHARRILADGHAALVQRYIQEFDNRGEKSLLFFNGLLSHAVEKEPVLQTEPDVSKRPAVRAFPHQITTEERMVGEEVRRALHGRIAELTGRDHLLIYCRIDIVNVGDAIKVLEVNLMDVTLYLKSSPEALNNFADAITVRAFA